MSSVCAYLYSFVLKNISLHILVHVIPGMTSSLQAAFADSLSRGMLRICRIQGGINVCVRRAKSLSTRTSHVNLRREVRGKL